MQKGVSGTHYVAEDKRKTAAVLVRFTAAEMEKVKDKAARSGVSVSEFLAQAGLNKRVRK
ncbi:MAG: hypothetical protein U0L14_07640 [Bifidobacterium ruminantium]|nr:hypothetical protein [Bifidobacterium ruminantium]